MARVDEVHKSLFRRLASEMHYEENSYDRRLHVSGSLQQWNVGRNQQQNGNLCQIPPSRVLVSTRPVKAPVSHG